MTTCHTNTRLHRTGCDASINGKQGHCVASAPWSTHPDGICHATFASQQISDLHWTRPGHTNPADVTDAQGRAKLSQDMRGVWHKTDAREHHRVTPQSDELALS